LQEQVDSLIQEMRVVLSARAELAPATSRIPGGRAVHKLFSRLLRRHHAPLVSWVAESNGLLLRLIEQLRELWIHQYRYEFELERRLHDGIMERLAELDSISEKVKVIESKSSGLGD
jgi:hypothetical protein